MGKTKNKNRSEIEHLRGENKELLKQVKSLKQRLKQLEKREHLIEDNPPQDIEFSTDNEDTMYHPHLKAIPCDDCGKGTFIEYEIMGKIIGTCGVCGNRKRLK